TVLLDLTDVILNEGKIVRYEFIPEICTLSYRFGDFRITDRQTGILEIENKGEQKLSVSGELMLEIEIPCARCLEPVRYGLMIRPELEIDLRDNDYIDGYYLDVDQLIHDEALLVWPERVLCHSECRGLCVRCGQNLNKGACSCTGTDLDPRMAKVLDIFSNYKEV
ncbi:MAG: DUF177 domain-containing protein, partial [Lachnospiraceae bacterium]|nr:DUF177 domain-containing protein [Lachnospiraceae bacterium]